MPLKRYIDLNTANGGTDIVEKADSDKRRVVRRSRRALGDSTKEAARLAALEIAMPQSDPAHSIVAGILRVVPASRWTFARVDQVGELVSFFGSESNGAGQARLEDEFKRQRAKVPLGPRIAATLGSLDDLASGITLLFADARANFGILTLLRTADLGPFTSSEISMLTFALDAASDRLSALRLHPPPPIEEELPEGALRPAEGAFYVLDRDLQIVLAWSSEDQRRVALTGLQTRIAERLPMVLEDTVRELTQAWSGDPPQQRAGVARPVSFLVVRTQPMSGPTGLFVGVHVDRFRPANSLTGAADRYHISPREVQVLALLLDGSHLDQISDRLHITSSTVQDHIKSMLDKTESRNRSELIARVLGWESTPSAPRE
jgi:DNA-binding CsgD family transcriptional regulator